MNAKIIIAGPGTGKTRRIIQLVKEFLDATPDSKEGFILCTFTRKAAEELHFKLFETVDPILLSGRHYLIDTIHSISLGLLKLHPDGKYAEYEIIPDDQQASYVNGQLPRLGFDRDDYKGAQLWNLCSDIAEIYSYSTDREIDLDSFDFSADENLRTIISNYSIYKKLLTRDNKFDFALVQTTLKNELINDSKFKNVIDHTFGAIFVDEYQDTNPIQHSLLMALAAPEFKIVVVGDDDQSIYGFRGAAVANLLEMPKFYEERQVEFDIEYLQNNHRSVSEIVSFSRNFISKSGIAGFKKEIKSFRGQGFVVPSLNEYENVLEEADAVVKNIKHLFDSGSIQTYSQAAILLRTAKNRSQAFAAALDKYSIPYRLIGVGDFFELKLVQEFMTLMNFIFNVKTDALDEFRNELQSINEYLPGFYFDAEIIIRISEIKDNWRNYKSSIAITYDLLSEANFFDRYFHDGANLGKLTSIVMGHDDNVRGLDLFGLYSYMSHLRREKLVDVEFDGEQNAVQVMTLHKAKGLEFDAVYLPAQNTLTPRKDIVDLFKSLTGISSDNHADELRLFYVGVTRARNYLWISRHRTSPTGKKTYEASSGFKVIQADKEFYDSCEIFPESDAITSTPKAHKKTPQLSYNTLYTYQICPKQYMYRNVWRLETARNAGMSYGSNLHKALQLINAEILSGSSPKNVDINTIMDIAWKPNWRSNEAENNKFRTTATNQLEMYASRYIEIFGDYSIYGIEKQFDISLEGTLITGRYDLLLKNSTEILIVDFKTGHERDYSFQLSFYEYCLSNELAQTKVDSQVYYLNTGKTAETPKLSKESIKKEINLTKIRIENQDFTATPGVHCDDCAFNLMCEEGLSRP